LQLHRNVRQGRPLAVFLVVLVVDLLAIAIRYDSNIHGLKIEGNTITLSQLADDTTCFLRDEASANRLLKVIDDFSKISGLRCNLDKTEAMWLGSNRGKPPGNIPVKWSDAHFKTLGIKFTFDELETCKMNYDLKLLKMSNLLRLWKMRDLTLIGRITVTRSLALSQLTYLVTSVHTPQDYTAQVQSVINQFIWKNGSHKVKFDIMSLPISEGGLKYPNFDLYSETLKLSFVKRILNGSSGKWILTFGSLFPYMKPQDLFKSRCKIDNKNMMHTLPLFYQDLIQGWSKLKAESEPLTVQEIQYEMLWFNPFIAIGGNTVFWKNRYQNGIIYVKDLLNANGELLLDDDLRAMYNIKFNFLQYHSLRMAIPFKWKTMMKREGIIMNSINFNVKEKSRDYYWQLLNRPSKCAQREKWHIHFNLNETDWQEIYKLAFKITQETKLQSFQFSLLYRFVPYKKRLCLMGLEEVNTCDYCELSDTLIHRFVTCPTVMEFWGCLETWWNECFSCTLHLSDKDIILGNFVQQTDYALNNIILNAKYYIHIQKCKKKIISFRCFQAILRNKIKEEAFILIKNKKGHTFYERWGKIIESLI
jgi:hypothetical protein